LRAGRAAWYTAAYHADRLRSQAQATCSARSASPTVGEAGYKEAVADPWNGVLAPAGTPPEIIDLLYRELARIVQLPEVRDRFAQMGMEPLATPPEQFSSEIREAVTRWPPIAKSAGVRPE
jgi:tripartite-type tricarboxylate transporter receptor subunit TctC